MRGERLLSVAPVGSRSCAAGFEAESITRAAPVARERDPAGGTDNNLSPLTSQPGPTGGNASGLFTELIHLRLNLIVDHFEGGFRCLDVRDYCFLSFF